ncbi:hypothetical protein BC832DRAFT_535981 [Gaertneriomyces semiglobifer]|nr:hypothetical protein BC832DRAFT_535981 [Gaertneriomyces semiglobifer]
MSHQSGIAPSAELTSLFNSIADNQRALKVAIDNETQLVVADVMAVAGTWEDDFNRISDWLENDKPSFILFKRDGGDWILGQYVPENARIRDKMLYASSKATLLKELGTSRFVDTVYGTTKDEFTWQGYQRHLTHKEAEAPLTEREVEMLAVKQAENDISISISSKRKHAKPVTFAFNDEVKAAFEKFSNGTLNVLILSVDVVREIFELDYAGDTTLDNVHSLLKPDVPRFVFYRMHHNQESPIVFIYVCPPSSKVKERMTYSSCLLSTLAALKEDMGLVPARKVMYGDDALRSY